MIYTSSLACSQIPTGDSIYDAIFSNPCNVPLDKPILIDVEAPYKTLTFGDLKDQILVAAAGFKREFNIEKNDVVAICSPNHIDYVTLVHGVICAGGIITPIHYTSPLEDITYDMNTVKAKVLIIHEDTAEKALAAAKSAGINESNIAVFGDTSIKGIRAVDDTILKGHEQAEPYKYTSEQMENDPACLYFTSGTTGRKKAIIRTQKHLMLNMIRKASRSNVRFVSYLDFNHATSLAQVLLVGLYYGATTYLLNHFSLRGLCAAIEKYRPQCFSCAPYIILSLINDSTVKDYDISSITVIASTGAVLKKSVIDQAYEKLGVKVVNCYGMTEASNMFEFSAEVTAMGGIGYLRAGVSARLIDEDGQDVPPGETGELLIKGPCITAGYYNNPEKVTDEEGYFHTGDLFKCNNGLFTFCDRSKDLMKYYGTQIYPSEIESVLMKHPKVLDCAAVGVYQADVAAEFPCAYVILAQGEHNHEEIAQELLAFSDSQLPEKKRIRAGIIILDSFPRTSSGKTYRRLLRKAANNVQVVA